MKRARRIRRWFLRLAAVALVTLVLGATGLWLSFQHIPAWYRPIHVPAQRHQTVRNDLTLTLNDLSARMAGGVPFDFTVTQGQLNDWLAARSRIWPGLRRWVPPWLDEPMVIFQPDRIVLAGIAAVGRDTSLRTVLSLHLSLAAEPDGLRVTLHRLQAGSLPAPLGPLRTRLESALADAQADRPPEKRITTAHLFGEDTFPNEFVWFNGKVPFRITAITTESGQIRLRFEPKPRKPRNRR